MTPCILPARRTLVGLAAGLMLGATTLLAACGSGSSNASTTTTAAPRNMRGDRYCEVLLLTVANGTASADVYNTYPLNDCPEAIWVTLDAGAIATANGATLAMLNGPRYWLMNAVEKQGVVAELPKQDFGGLEMYRQANVNVGSMAAATKPYIPHAVDRSTVFVFDAGQRVYELHTADGTTYVMQTFSQQKDPTLTEAQLTDLGQRLTLPEGWTYSSRVLDQSLRIATTDVPAQVLQDDLGNSYSMVPG